MQEICEVPHMTPEEGEIQRQKGYIRFTTQKGTTVYEIKDLLLIGKYAGDGGASIVRSTKK